MMILTPLKHRVELKIDRNIEENLSHKKCIAGFR